jgi:hypothetical protein
MAMTPAVPQSDKNDNTDDERVSANRESFSVNSISISNGDHETRSGGFMANTLGHLKLNALGGKIRDRSEAGYVNALGDESEDSSRRKSKLLLGKKILGGLADR